MNGQYQPHNYYNPYNANKPPKKPMVLAVLSFVLSLTSGVVSCFGIYVPIAVFLMLVAATAAILGIAALATHSGGKGFAIAGIIISVIMFFSFLLSVTVFRGINEDMLAFSQDPQKYVEEYDRTGEIPEEFMEYTDPKYDAFWGSMGIDGFEEFYEQFIDQYRQQYGYSSPYYDYDDYDRDESSSRPDNFGEAPVNI